MKSETWRIQLITACRNGKLNALMELMQGSYAMDFHSISRDALMSAIRGDHWNVVEFLTTSEEMKIHGYGHVSISNEIIHQDMFDTITLIVDSQAWKIMEGTLTSEVFKSLHGTLNFRGQNDLMIRRQAIMNRVDSVKYLLTNPTLKKYCGEIDLHACNDRLFENICLRCGETALELLKWLLFDHGMSITPKMEQQAQENEHQAPQVLKLLHQRKTEMELKVLAQEIHGLEDPHRNGVGVIETEEMSGRRKTIKKL